MITALTFLIAQGILGALDTLIYHELRAHLPSTPAARRELRLHAARDFAYAIIFALLGWFEPHGTLAWALAAVLAMEIVITLYDFVEEDATRRLPAGERIMHTIMAIIYGAFLAHLVPQIVLWGRLPNALAATDYGPVSWIMTAFACGVFLSGVRDLAASMKLKPPGPGV
ncbi:MAG: hypothetical protein JST22_21260 [Bacteroidetes bacterium]|nr:hypothetical protein [Bacteroidota bacterium]